MTEQSQTPAISSRRWEWREAIARAIPRPKALKPRGKRPVRRILVLIKGPNPTYSYYLEARLLLGTSVPFHVLSIDDTGDIDVDPTDTFVIVCRYIRRRQIEWLKRHRDSLAGTAYFIDDDIAALAVEPGAGLAYRTYIAWFGSLPLRRLNEELTDVWASTPALRDKLESGGDIISLLRPAPLLADNQPLPRKASGPHLTIAFHATDVHRAEHAFLVPVLATVMAARPHTRFEVSARGAMKALWLGSGIHHSRLSVLPLQPWPVYQKQSREHGADIFLMPLANNAGNSVRADTKRIDCCRLGAAGIFAEGAVYGTTCANGEILAGADQDRWIEALLRLIDSSDLRQKASEATRASVTAMAETARDGFPGFPSSPDMVLQD